MNNTFYHEETESHFMSIKAWSQQMPSMHYHDSYELYYLDSGTREYFVEDNFFSVTAGNFVLIPPSTFHRTGGDYARRILIGFTHDFLSSTYSPETVTELLQCFDKTLISPSDEVLTRCKSILNSLKDCKTDRDFALYLGILLAELSKCQNEPPHHDNQMSNLIEYINTHFGDIHSIEQIANHFFISKYYLCRIFKNTMGLTIIDYLNKIRIKKACEYLTNTNQSVQEIALLCGFNSSTYFSSVFKNSMHLSPKEYRKHRKL